MNNGPQHYACLYVRELPAQAFLTQQPELRTRGVVVMEGEPPLQAVCSLNTKARLQGITHGMTAVEVETFPETKVLPRSSQVEAAVRGALLEAAGGFSPRVEDRSTGTAFLCGMDISGTQTLFGEPEALAKSLLQRVRALGISACVTVSKNFYAAVCLAKGIARNVASHVIRDGEEASDLSPLPLEVLELSQEQEETFASWGIQTVGMLAALPEEELISRLGKDGGRLRLMARGELRHFFQPMELPLRLKERREFDTPIEDLESLLFCVALLLDQLIAQASARMLALASMSIHLNLDGGSTHTVTVQPALPNNDKHLWLKLLRHKLDWMPPAAGVLAFEVYAEPGATSKVQLGLFSPQLPEPSRLDLMLARLTTVVGECNVGRAVLQDTHAPDGFRMEAFRVPSGDAKALPPTTPRACVRQLRPGEKAHVTLQRGKPSTFSFRERRYLVQRTYGPWRDSGAWWSSSLWGAEQWDLVASRQDGELLCCCLVRDLMQNEWQVTALYD
jgi:protein ImuB